MKDVIHKYLRPKKKFPHVWCPGCGNGIILGAVARAVDSIGLSKDEVVLVSGIGCSSRAPVYLDFASLHGTHGRALAFATGIKFANPELTVIVLSGDGDGLAIGGNHFIHACRRNIDLTLIIFNNNIYGMTGGQYSPTMSTGAYGATAPYGNIERPFDVCSLAASAGANFVARATVSHVFLLEKYIKQGILKKGFSVIDAVTPCPSIYSFFNKTGNAVMMMKALREKAVMLERVAAEPDENLKDKIVMGIFADRNYKEYTQAYNELIEKAKRSKKDEEPL